MSTVYTDKGVPMDYQFEPYTGIIGSPVDSPYLDKKDYPTHGGYAQMNFHEKSSIVTTGTDNKDYDKRYKLDWNMIGVLPSSHDLWFNCLVPKSTIAARYTKNKAVPDTRSLELYK